MVVPYLNYATDKDYNITFAGCCSNVVDQYSNFDFISKKVVKIMLKFSSIVCHSGKLKTETLGFNDN